MRIRKGHKKLRGEKKQKIWLARKERRQEFDNNTYLYYPNLFQSSYGEVYCREELEINLEVLLELKKKDKNKRNKDRNSIGTVATMSR